MANLYIVATPIGNLEDLSFRAVRILKEVDVIAAEDTRKTRILLNHYEIRPKRLLSCRAQNEKVSAPGLVKLLDQGQDMAYVTDAGTPGISDPGHTLVRCAREAKHTISPLPGPSAVVSLVSVAGGKGKGYYFEGFLSPKSGRRSHRLGELLEGGFPFVLYESPHRILKLLENLSQSAPQREIFIGREMTKKFEEFWSGTAEEAFKGWSSHKNLKGEFSILVHGGKKD